MRITAPAKAPRPRPAPWLIALALAASLPGCAQLQPDQGMADLRAAAQASLGASAQQLQLQNSHDAQQTAARTSAGLLATPLSSDSAVQLALLNNRALQAAYAALGIADAEWVQLTRLPNPGFSFKRLRQGEAGSSALDIERGLSFNLLQVVRLPALNRLGRAEYERTRSAVLQAVQDLIADTRVAYVEAVAAEQNRAYARQVALAAEASSELAAAMSAAGNWSKRDEAREAAFLAESEAQVQRAEREAVAARERLTRLLGLAHSDAFTLPERLPEIPAAALTLVDAETLALDQRLDLAAGRQQLASLAENLGLTRQTRYLNALELAGQRNTTTGEAGARGFELSLEIPLFDWGEARVARAEGLYLQQAQLLAQTAVNARSEVRERYAAYRAAHQLATHYRERLLPQRKRLAEENLRRYNGMLISVFELLADAREQIGAVSAAQDAIKDYWLAEARLQQALGGPLPAAPVENGAPPAVPATAPTNTPAATSTAGENHVHQH